MNRKNQFLKISSINEIRLLRRNLKRELHFAEERIENETQVILAGYKSWLTYYIIEKGVSSALSFIGNKLFRRRF